MNQLRFIRDVIYNLKRDYGVKIKIINTLTSDVNRATGKKIVTRDIKIVQRAIVLPSRNQREFYYDLSFIAANKNFTMGGYVDTDERKFIVDRRDLKGMIISVGQSYLIYQDQRFDVKEVAEFEESNTYGLICKQSVAASSEDNVIELKLISSIGFDQQTNVEVD